MINGDREALKTDRKVLEPRGQTKNDSGRHRSIEEH